MYFNMFDLRSGITSNMKSACPPSPAYSINYVLYTLNFLTSLAPFSKQLNMLNSVTWQNYHLSIVFSFQLLSYYSSSLPNSQMWSIHIVYIFSLSSHSLSHRNMVSIIMISLKWNVLTKDTNDLVLKSNSDISISYLFTFSFSFLKHRCFGFCDSFLSGVSFISLATYCFHSRYLFVLKVMVFFGVQGCCLFFLYTLSLGNSSGLSTVYMVMILKPISPVYTSLLDFTSI